MPPQPDVPEQAPFLPRVNGRPDSSLYTNPRASIPTGVQGGTNSMPSTRVPGDRGNIGMNLPPNDAAEHMMFPSGSFSMPDLNDTSLAPTMAIDSGEINALLKRQSEMTAPPEPTTTISPSADLPAWLTDQSIISPSQAMFPVNAPQAGSVPFMPATPGDNARSGEWFQQPLQTTTDQLPGGQGNGSGTKGLQETEILRRSSPEWQPDLSPAQKEEESQFSLPFYESQGQNQDYRDIISQGASGQLGRLTKDSDDEDPLLSTSSTRVQQAAQRNYPALVNALQTLGYAVPGFIAAALVTVEGHPVAQVVVDDSDMTPIYQYIGTFLTHAVQNMDQNWWGAFEHTVISGRDRHLVLRAVSAEKNVFQVLIAARGTDPAVCLETMENVEGSISAALH
jgi:predicted regulator of Ras-like GTPase activity (Roadblock/LC7/MglB family)